MFMFRYICIYLKSLFSYGYLKEFAKDPMLLTLRLGVKMFVCLNVDFLEADAMPLWYNLFEP